jgi:hypothetical protein
VEGPAVSFPGTLCPGVYGDRAQAAACPCFEQKPGRSERDGAVGSQPSVAAVVQQDVAAPVKALIEVNAPLYSCCQGLKVRRIPVVSGEVPHHWSEAKFFCSAQHIGAAGAEGRSKPFHCFAGRIFDGGTATHELFADPLGPFPEQRGMGHGVVPQQMAALVDRPGNLRMPAHIAAHQEEGRTYLAASEQIKQLLGVGIIRAVVEGERDFVNIGAGDNGAAEELRGWPFRGISIPSGRKPGEQTRGDQLGKHASRV